MLLDKCTCTHAFFLSKETSDTILSFISCNFRQAKKTTVYIIIENYHVALNEKSTLYQADMAMIRHEAWQCAVGLYYTAVKENRHT